MVLIDIITISSEGVDLVSKFDSQRAWRHVVDLTQMGPRPSGSPGVKQAQVYLTEQLRGYGLEVEEQRFWDETPRGKMEFVNIRAKRVPSWWGRHFGRKKSLLILASHYDTKFLPGMKFVGANDGGSSTGVLLEIARVLAQEASVLKDHDFECVFFDGEEALEEYSSKDGLYGSRYYVKSAKEVSPHKKLTHIAAVILMDMVGDRDLLIQIPQGHPDLNNRVFDASLKLGYRNYFRSTPYPMIDDHYPFVLEGVPAIDLIDFHFGPENSWWHTEKDLLENICPESLAIVGKTILGVLETYGKK